MSRTYWLVWWAFFIGVFLLSATIGPLIGRVSVWAILLLVVIFFAMWITLTVRLGLRTPNASQHFAFVWGTAVPIVWGVPLLVLSGLEGLGVRIGGIFTTLWNLAVLALLLGGGIAVIVLWAVRKFGNKTAIPVEPAVGDGTEDDSTPQVGADEFQALVRDTSDAPAQQSGLDTPKNGQFRMCPFCAERIRVEAIKCKHCQSMLAT